MAFVSKEEKEKYYNTYPPGTKVLILTDQEWYQGRVIERYGENGTVKIRCQMKAGYEFTILYSHRGEIRIAGDK